jgi:hypothetical protein
MQLSLKHSSRRRLIAVTWCTLAGLCWLPSFRQPAPANAEHNLPPVIRQHVDDNDNAVVPACRTITSYLNHAANPNARTSWHALNEQVSELSDLASQYLNTAQRTNDQREQQRLEDLADRAQDEADRLYDQILAIKP